MTTYDISNYVICLQKHVCAFYVLYNIKLAAAAVVSMRIAKVIKTFSFVNLLRHFTHDKFYL